MSLIVRLFYRSRQCSRVRPLSPQPLPTFSSRPHTFVSPGQEAIRSRRRTQLRYYSSTVDPRTLLLASLVAVGIAWYSAGSSGSRKETPFWSNPSGAIPSRPNPSEATRQDKQLFLDLMGHQPLPGRPGNLTPEQETQLKEMWAQTLELFGMSPDEVRAQSNQAATSSTTSDPPDKKKKKGIMGRFGRKGKDDESEADPTGGVDNDKHGQVKQFEQALASMKPDEIREAFWMMTKHDHPDAILLRFLRARKWDIHAAQVMALSTLHWRLQDARVDDNIMARGEEHALKQSKETDAKARKEGEDFLQQYRMGKSMLHGTDKDGRPCCYVRVRLHRAGEQCTESLERFTVHTIETARMLLRPPVDTATIVFDMTDFSMANMDYTPVKFMIKVFEANYPESLGSVLVYKAPWIFQGIWKIIRGWLDPVVASKVHFASNVSELEEYIPRARIIKELGGEMDWSYRYIEPEEGENQRMNDAAGREKLLADRQELIKSYEAETLRWIHGENRMEQRDALAHQLAENYWTLDPFVRARSLYDRLGVIGPMGELDFYPPNHTLQTKKESLTTGTTTAAPQDEVD